MVPQLTVRIRRIVHPFKVRGSDRGSYSSDFSFTVFKVRHEDADLLPVLSKYLLEQDRDPGQERRNELPTLLAVGWPKQIKKQLAPGEFTFLSWLQGAYWRFVFPSIGAMERLAKDRARFAPTKSMYGREEIRMDAPSKTLFKQFVKIHKPHGSPFKLVSTPVWELGRYQ